MPERSPEEIRREMAAERRRLDESREALRAELRSLVPVVVVGAAALGYITVSKGLKAGIRTIRALS